MLIEKLFRLIAYYFCLSTHQVTFAFKTLDGRFNKAYIKENTRRLSLESCLNFYCQGETNCVVNYNNLDLTCRHVAYFSAQVLEWAADKHVIHDNNWKIAYRLTNPFPKVPIIVWLLDQVAKGNNYGSIPALTTSAYLLDYTKKNKGPTPRSGLSLIYPQSVAHSWTEVRVGVGGANVFNLKKPFTLAMWIKTTKKLYLTLLNSNVWGILWEMNRPSLGQMYLYVVDAGAVTEKNMTNIFEWRHVALIMNPKAPKIYIDGYENKLVKNDIKPNPPFKNELYRPLIWADNWQQDVFQGAMACRTVFQPYLLSDSEIRNLRKICP